MVRPLFFGDFPGAGCFAAASLFFCGGGEAAGVFADCLLTPSLLAPSLVTLPLETLLAAGFGVPFGFASGFASAVPPPPPPFAAFLFGRFCFAGVAEAGEDEGGWADAGEGEPVLVASGFFVTCLPVLDLPVSAFLVSVFTVSGVEATSFDSSSETKPQRKEST